MFYLLLQKLLSIIAGIFNLRTHVALEKRKLIFNAAFHVEIDGVKNITEITFCSSIKTGQQRGDYQGNPSWLTIPLKLIIN